MIHLKNSHFSLRFTGSLFLFFVLFIGPSASAFAFASPPPSASASASRHSKNQNIFNAFGPGIYQIYCKINQRRYIGESNNILDRLAKHTRNFQKGFSECYELQQDWNLYGSGAFEASVLYIGPEWNSREARIKKESEIINSYSPEKVYNVHSKYLKKTAAGTTEVSLRDKTTRETYRVVCEINSVRFESIADASRQTCESETRIRTKLYNKHPGYILIEKKKQGSSIIVNGKSYDSIGDAVIAGEAKDRFEAIRKLKNPKKKNWNYLDV